MPSPRREQGDYYRRLEEELTALLAAMAEYTEADRLKQPREFVEHGEYGLALEALCEAVSEGQIELSAAGNARIESLGHMMGLNATSWKRLPTLAVPCPATSRPDSTRQI